MKRISENTKVTLTFKQLKQLVKEGHDGQFGMDEHAGLDFLTKHGVFQTREEAGEWYDDFADAISDAVENYIPESLNGHGFWSDWSVNGNDRTSYTLVDDVIDRLVEDIEKYGDPKQSNTSDSK